MLVVGRLVRSRFILSLVVPVTFTVRILPFAKSGLPFTASVFWIVPFVASPRFMVPLKFVAFVVVYLPLASRPSLSSVFVVNVTEPGAL